MSVAAGPEVRAEIEMLARLLGSEPGELAYLEELPPESLRALRRAATDHLYDADRDGLTRIAATTGVLPAKLAATLGERFFGPLLCARIAALVDPDRARAIAERLGTEFLADVAIEIDPRRISEVVRGLPVERIVEVATELSRRDETLTMGRFVGHLPADVLIACLEVIPDEQLLPIYFALDDKAQLDRVVATLPDERLAAIGRDGSQNGHGPAILSLIDHLGPEQAERVTAAAEAAGID